MSGTITCDNCGKSFKRRLSHRKKHLFCSIACRTAYSSKDVRADWDKIVHLYGEGNSVKDIAVELDYEYPRLLYWVKKLWVDEELRKSYHYGLKFRTYQEPSTRKGLHRKVRRQLEEYRKRCVVCGWDKDNCDLHAIDGGKVVIGNLVSLCPNCHRLLHRGKLKLSEDIVQSARRLVEVARNEQPTLEE